MARPAVQDVESYESFLDRPGSEGEMARLTVWWLGDPMDFRGWLLAVARTRKSGAAWWALATFQRVIRSPYDD
jgi:hypothetical protein